MESPITGRQQNCMSYGTYEPFGSDKPYAALCHGGFYEGANYSECPVRLECKNATDRKRIEAGEREVLPQLREAMKDENNPLHSMFKPRVFRVPDFSDIPTTIPMRQVEEEPEEEEEDLEEDDELEEDEEEQEEEAEEEEPEEEDEAVARASAAPTGRRMRGPKGKRFPRAVMPDGDAPRGMRSAFASRTPGYGEIAPTFLPSATESPWKRLFKNVAQGILAAIGFTLWNYCRTIDLFG